jgi:transcriptional regulator with XRE-family HTH domain
MELLRTQQGRSKAEVARAADLPTTFVTWAEQGRYTPYPVQTKRLASALYYTSGDPEDLLKEVPEDDA